MDAAEPSCDVALNRGISVPSALDPDIVPEPREQEVAHQPHSSADLEGFVRHPGRGKVETSAERRPAILPDLELIDTFEQLLATSVHHHYRIAPGPTLGVRP